MTTLERKAAAKLAWETMRSKGYVNGRKPAGPPKPRRKLTRQEPIKLPKDPRFASPDEVMLKTCVMSLTLSGIGNRRKVDSDTIEAKGTDKAWLHTTKKLLECDELKEITSIFNDARSCVVAKALPYFIKEGVHMVPTAFIEELRTKLKDLQKRLEVPVKSMCQKLPVLKRAAKERLGPKYKDDDYWTAAELADAFRLNYRIFYVDGAPDPKTVSRAIYEEEKEKAAVDMREMQETHVRLLRTHFSGMLNHLIDKLKPEPGGRSKIFHESSIGKLASFINEWDKHNVWGDQQMSILISNAKNLLKDTDADSLRTDEAVRDHIKYGFETIKTLLDPMIVQKPTRRITFED